MTIKNSESKLAFVTLCTTMAKGLSALPDTTLTVEGVTSPKTDFIQPLTNYVNCESEVTTTEAAYHDAVQNAHVAEVPALEVVRNVTPYLRVRLGKSSAQLLPQFGVKPEKEPVRKVAVKAAAAAKGVATKSKKKAAAAAAVAPVAATPPAAPAAPTNGGTKASVT